jgi:hypothetical protein
VKEKIFFSNVLFIGFVLKDKLEGWFPGRAVWVFWPNSCQVGQERICVVVGTWQGVPVGVFKAMNTVKHIDGIGAQADMDYCCWPLKRLPVVLLSSFLLFLLV